MKSYASNERDCSEYVVFLNLGLIRLVLNNIDKVDLRSPLVSLKDSGRWSWYAEGVAPPAFGWKPGPGTQGLQARAFRGSRNAAHVLKQLRVFGAAILCS